MRAMKLFGIAMVGVLALACAEESVEPEFDNEDAAADEAAADDDSKADVAGGTYTFYTVRRDLRRCAAPLCGGYWVDRVNATKTRCADGTYAEECYVAELDLVTKMGFRDRETSQVFDAINSRSAVLRGVVKKKTYETGAQLGLFEAKEAWVAATDAPPEGTFSKIADSGIRCFAAPCPSLNEAKLNSSARKNIAGVGLDALNLDEGELHLANVFLQGEGLIVAGYRGTTTGPAGDAPTREATQAYFRVVAPAIEPVPCFVGGCSGQVCSNDPGVVTTCEWRPEYACYRSATCGIDADGSCGWVETAELTSCLEGSR